MPHSRLHPDLSSEITSGKGDGTTSHRISMLEKHPSGSSQVAEKATGGLETPDNSSFKHVESTSPNSTEEIEEAVDDHEDDWENDPENARNWSTRKKWTAVCIVSAYAFVVPLSSSMMAPGIPEIANKYRITNSTITALTLSIFILALAFAPLILAPLSEMYGRTWVLHIGNLLTLAFSLGCAFAPNTDAFIVFHFLSGLSASAPTACGAGSIGDLFAAHERASAMSLYTLGSLVGPAMGPIAGGFIVQTIGIKWVFINIAIACGVVSLLGIPLLRETYAPVIRLRRAKKSLDLEDFSKAHSHLQQDRSSIMNFLWVNLSRPITTLFGSFICFVLSLYMAFMYGIFFLMFITFGDLFQSTYGFTPGVGGLAYLGLSVGYLLASFSSAKFADGIYKYLGEKNGGVSTPEMRIPLLFFGSFLVPLGIFWYGWSAQAKLHWIMPIIGSGIFAFGTTTTFLPILLYLVDSFAFAASATSAAAFFRSLLGFAFPLFGQNMYDKLGLGGGSSLLGGLSIILGIPFPVYLYYRGEALRAANPLTRASTLPKFKS